VRIIAGKWRGRRIAAPEGRSTRPTGDRVREALFSSLHSRIGSFEGLRVLDAFAGSGALGLESLSRGAALFAAVESNPKTARLIEDNYLGLQSPQSTQDDHDKEFRLYRGDIFRVASRLKDAAFDLGFFDPPYDLSDEKLCELLELLATYRAFAYGALLVIERSKQSDPESVLPSCYTCLDVKRKGETILIFAQFTP